MKNKITIESKELSTTDEVWETKFLEHDKFLITCEISINGKNITGPHGVQKSWLLWSFEIKDFLEIERTPSMAVLYLKKYADYGSDSMSGVQASLYSLILKISKGYELEVIGNRKILKPLRGS